MINFKTLTSALVFTSLLFVSNTFAMNNDDDVEITPVPKSAIGQKFVYSTPFQNTDTFKDGDSFYVGRNGFARVIIGGKSADLMGFRYGQSGVTPEGLPDMKMCGFAYAAFTTGWDLRTSKFKSPLKIEYKDGKVFARNKEGKLLEEFFFLDEKPSNTKASISEFLAQLKAQKDEN